jgi:DNA polymerase III epsilon subunit-like protein
VEIGALRFSLALAGPSPSGQASGPAAESRWEAVEHEALSVLVDPGIRIPPIVTGIHGIRDEDVAGKPAFSGYAARLLALAEGAIIIAHNAPFDLGFLREELLRAGLPACAAAAVDTRMLAKAAFPGLPSYSLGNLARGLGIETGNSHRALDDARACMRLFLASASRIAPARAAPLPPCGEGLP